MRRSPWAIGVCFLTACALGQATAPAPPAGNEADKAAAQSLLHSATSLVYAPAGTPARAGRLVTLASAAAAMDRDEPRAAAVLSDIRQMQGKLSEAADAAWRELAARPEDYSAGLQWLKLSLAGRETSEERLEFLELLCRRQELPAPLRAQGQADMAQILLGQGEAEKGARAFQAALELDPYLPAAVLGALSAKRDATVADRVKALTDVIRGDPQSVETMWDLGILLASLGLHEQALELFEPAYRLMLLRGGPDEQDETFTTHYANALLDAARHERAVELLTGLPKRFDQSVDLLSLAVEAHQAAGGAQQANAVAARLESLLKGEDRPAPRKNMNKELAHFFTHVVQRPLTALHYANKAIQQEPRDPLTIRILGCAEVCAGQAGQGMERLVPLAAKDGYAALCLAEHYYETDQPALAAKTLLAGAGISRSGPAFRRLAALAAKHKVPLPPSEHAQAVQEQLAKLDGRYLRMAVEPEKFISVSVRPAREVFAPMEPMELEVTLANIGELPVPLGPKGLFSPAIRFEVSVAGSPKGQFAHLPMAQLPTGRYLKPSQAVSTTVRLDVGAFEDMLLWRPLERMSLSVQPMVDPIQRGLSFRSALPALRLEPVTVVRSDVVGQFAQLAGQPPDKAYKLALGYIVRDIKQGTLQQRMRSARQVGSLLAYLGRVSRGSATLPRELATAVEKPVLLSMMRAVLQDPAGPVRAEMLAALGRVEIDDLTASLLAEAVKDDDPLVRLRVAELAGMNAATAFGAGTLKALASDPSEMVRTMVAAFRPKL